MVLVLISFVFLVHITFTFNVNRQLKTIKTKLFSTIIIQMTNFSDLLLLKIATNSKPEALEERSI